VAAYGEIDTDVAERAQTNPGMVVFLNDGDAVLTKLQVGKRYKLLLIKPGTGGQKLGKLKGYQGTGNKNTHVGCQHGCVL
jgi:hypothetical protein